VKKLRGENDIEVLRRLDWLIPDEAQATAAQTLEVIYARKWTWMVRNPNLSCSSLTAERSLSRTRQIGRQYLASSMFQS
jgi:hypothetical protein